LPETVGAVQAQDDLLVWFLQKLEDSEFSRKVKQAFDALPSEEKSARLR
jgi:hypothetical protein